MTERLVLETPRLRLRAFREDERARFADLNADPDVGVWLGGVLSREQSDAAFDRTCEHIAEHGFGLWAIERKADGVMIGQAGLDEVPGDLPPAPAVEMSWRLFPDAWGRGYASEAAAAALAWGLANLKDARIVAFTTRTNRRSEGVMRRIGLVRSPSLDFEHPRLALGHPLRSHIVYVAPR
jgi:RimJ/RimL family protein N-acetyltransferase